MGNWEIRFHQQNGLREGFLTEVEIASASWMEQAKMLIGASEQIQATGLMMKWRTGVRKRRRKRSLMMMK
jgi:hypothetical protein